MEWWGLPTRLEWALAPDRGALGYQTGSLAARMAFGRLRGPWVQELMPSSFLRAALGWSAGMLRPAAKVLAGSWGDSLGAFRCMLNSCCDRVGTAREGVMTPCLLGIEKSPWLP